jgi:hypothetical protein
MSEIEFENLASQNRNEYHRIYAYDDKETVLVEDRKWMPCFVDHDHPAPETRILYVRVQNCDDVTIRSIRAKIECECPC